MLELEPCRFAYLVSVKRPSKKITSPDIGVFWFLLIFGEHVMSYLIFIFSSADKAHRWSSCFPMFDKMRGSDLN